MAGYRHKTKSGQRSAPPSVFPLFYNFKEIPEDIHPVFGVLDLRVELDAVYGTVYGPHGLVRARIGGGDDLETLGNNLDLIVVGCPYLESVREPPENIVVGPHVDGDPAEFRDASGAEFPAEMLAYQLHAGAYPEDREIGSVQEFAAVPEAPAVGGD
jgi:hypothetical protein